MSRLRQWFSNKRGRWVGGGGGGGGAEPPQFLILQNCILQEKILKLNCLMKHCHVNALSKQNMF